MMTWKTRLHQETVQFLRRKEFSNLFIDLNLNEVDGFISEEMAIKDLQEIGVKGLNSGRFYEAFFMSMVINWQLFKSRSEIQSHADLLSPYEPVCKLLSRGGAIFVSEGHFIIDSFDAYLSSKSPILLPSLEDEFLNYIDEHCSDFPNQLKINGLWDGFNKSQILL
ncbi:hypothetical protein [Pedobacter gandavensis]|uniref:hypothetical protein n=1 Tax=Pedobacter gandavensis TaxID=2679963 RepID=UPI0016032211|nr:hypothetical protein [Pedobacter gandavensis]